VAKKKGTSRRKIAKRTTIGPKYLYRYRPFNQFSISELANQNVWFSSVNDFNDPFEVILDRFTPVLTNGYSGSSEYLSTPETKQLHEMLKDIFTTLGLLCFTTKNNNTLMWSHYADSHKGFCIEYERDPTNDFWKQVEPVNYVSTVKPILELVTEIFDIKLFKSKPVNPERFPQLIDTLIKKSIYCKDKSWAYENEWRFMCSKTEPGLSRTPLKISRIIFGLRLSPWDRETLLNLTRNIKGIEYQHANGAIKDNFEMEIVDDFPFSKVNFETIK